MNTTLLLLLAATGLTLGAAEPATGLLTIRRVYVDPLTGGAPAAQIRDLLIASLQSSGLFTITEVEENADAFLRGAASEDVYTENHVIDESIGGRVNVYRGRAVPNSTKSTARNSDSSGVNITERESSRIQERHHEAIVTVRLVLRNGDVVWSTIQESGGAKFKGANSDVAAKVARQLFLDVERMKRNPGK